MGTVPLTLRTTPYVVKLVTNLSGKGVYAKNPSATAEQLLREKLRDIYGDVALAGPPPSPDEAETAAAPLTATPSTPT